MIVLRKQLNLKAINIILNSSLTSFYLAVKFGKMQRGTFPQLKLADLKIFRIPKSIVVHEEELVEIYDKKLSNKIDDKEIDDYVMNLFALDNETKEIITNFCFSD